MELVKYTPEDLDALKELLSLCYEKDSPINLLNPETLMLLKEGEKLVALVDLSTNDIHFRVPEVIIAVHPDYRRRGVATELHAAVLEHYPLLDDEIGYDGCCYRDNEGARALMGHLGYRKYLDCHVLTLNLNAELTTPGSYSVVTADSVDRERLKSFLIDRYIEEHHWSPPRERDHDVWKEICNNYDDKLSVVAVDGDEILGASLSFGSFGEDGVIAFGWTYSKELARVEKVAIEKEILATQMRLAREKGAAEAYMEVDSSEATAQAILGWLPVKKHEIYERYRLHVSENR